MAQAQHQDRGEQHIDSSSHFCRWKSGGSPFKGETVDVPSQDARPAAEQQNNVSESTSSRRGALQKGDQKVASSTPDMSDVRPAISIQLLHCPGNGAHVQSLIKSTARGKHQIHHGASAEVNAESQAHPGKIRQGQYVPCRLKRAEGQQTLEALH